MRRLESKASKNKRQRRNNLAIGIILIIVMFFSVVGYSFQGVVGDTSKKVIYRGFTFTQSNGVWVTGMGNFQFAFGYNPNEVEKSDAEVKLVNEYNGKPLYIFSESEEASYEIYNNLNQVASRIQSACPVKEEGCDEDLPEKTCENNFIIIREDSTSVILQEDGCVFIKGPAENLTKQTDEFLFKALGIEE